jgi:ABC-type nitrate/sulfonate/bicarbonate transport system ATPase subunit
MGIRTINASKRIKNPATTILSDINLEIFEGDFISFQANLAQARARFYIF